MDSATFLVLGIGLLLQVCAAVLAWRLTRVTRRHLAWILMSLAFASMVVRRLLAFGGFPVGESALVPHVAEEGVALVTSLLMCIGILLIRPVFADLKDANEKLKAEMLERERATEKQRESEERYRDLFENSSDTIYTHDLDGSYRSINRAGERLLGYSRKQFCGLNFRDIIVPEDLPTAIENLRRKIESDAEETGPYDVRVRCRDGSLRWVEVTSRIVQKHGQPVGVQGSARDVTERKQAEQALQASEERFREVVELLPQPLFEVDVAGRVTYVSRKAFEIFGYAPEDVERGLDAEQMLVPDERGRAQENTARVLQGEYLGGTMYRALRKDGSTFPALIASAPIMTDGRVVGLRGVITDFSEREAAQEEIRRQNEFLTTVLESLTHPFTVIDANDYSITMANSAATNAGALEGSPCYAISHRGSAPCNGPDETCPIAEVKKSKQPLMVEHIHYGADGNSSIVEVHAYPVFDAKGSVVQVIEYCLDVTARKHAEERQRESEERFQKFANEASFEGIVIHREGRILFVNEVFARMYGYDRADLVGRDVLETFAPESREIVSHQIGKGSELAYEAVSRKKDGSRFPVKIHAKALPFEGGTVRAAAVRDLTDRKQAEEELRESETRFRSLFEAAREFIEILDGNGCILEANPAVVQSLGYAHHELIGRNVMDFFTPDSRGRFSQHSPGLAAQGACNGEVELVAKDGRILVVDCSGSVILDAQGHPKYLVLVQHDLSEHKRLEQQLRQAVKMEAIGRLAGGVAHDFNNLLTAIMGYSSMLVEQLPADSEHVSKLVQIDRASKRAAALTQQLLAFSRKQVLDMSVVDINRVIRDVGEMLGRLIGEDIELLLIEDPGLGKVHGDPGQLEQIVVNLAVNARDAMVHGGELTIETSNAFLDEDYARFHPEVTVGRYAMIGVSDSGVGMDAETCSRIFDPFFTTKEKGFGTGLGLSTVYGIVKQHQGHISVYSEPGMGTTFKIYLPLVDEPSNQVSRSSTAAGQVRGTETILIVEDEEIVRNLAGEALEMLGYLVLKARDPGEALVTCEQHEGKIHLLLTDIMLPKMDGRALSEKLTALRPEMVVIYMSGYTDDAVVRQGLLDHGNHFLQKPFTMDSLAMKVRGVLDGSHGNAGT